MVVIMDEYNFTFTTAEMVLIDKAIFEAHRSPLSELNSAKLLILQDKISKQMKIIYNEKYGTIF